MHWCFVLFQISNISHHYFLLCLLLPGAYYYNALFCNFAISSFPNNKALSYGQDGQFVVQQRFFSPPAISLFRFRTFSQLILKAFPAANLGQPFHFYYAVAVILKQSLLDCYLLSCLWHWPNMPKKPPNHNFEQHGNCFGVAQKNQDFRQNFSSLFLGIRAAKGERQRSWIVRRLGWAGVFAVSAKLVRPQIIRVSCNWTSWKSGGCTFVRSTLNCQCFYIVLEYWWCWMLVWTQVTQPKVWDHYKPKFKWQRWTKISCKHRTPRRVWQMAI